MDNQIYQKAVVVVAGSGVIAYGASKFIGSQNYLFPVMLGTGATTLYSRDLLQAMGSGWIVLPVVTGVLGTFLTKMMFPSISDEVLYLLATNGSILVGGYAYSKYITASYK